MARMLLLFLLLPVLCSAESPSNNYEKQSLSVSYSEEDGLPTTGVLNGTVTELDDLSPTIALNKTQAELNCSSGFMSVKLKFEQAFFGIVYADFDRNSACRIAGNGKTEETIQLPLKGCGTLQRPARVFTNNIIIRFHHGLEIDGDEVITIVCRYPPPIVPVPPSPAPIILPAVEEVTTLQPLREFEILLIICAIIFLALMLLGIGCSYYCLQKRNIKVIRRRPASTLGSEITKASEPISGFTGLKIPRPTADPASGTDEMTESIRTDFASEVASLESEEEYTSAYSDKLCVLAEGVIATRVAEPPIPRFDVDMIVRDGRGGAITPVMSSASSETGTILNAQEQYLTTVLERTETNTLETLERVRRAKAAAAAKQQIPVHARINVRQRDEPMSAASGTDDTMSEYSHATELYSEQEIEVESRPMRNFAIVEEEETMETKTEMHRQDMTTHGDNRGHMTVTVRSGGGDGGVARRRSSANMSNFDVLFRIVTVTDDYGGAAATTDQDELSSIFTSDERRAIRRALEQDSHLQTELRSTYERTEFRQLMSAHSDLHTYVSPHKWDVLIRVLESEDAISGVGGATTDADSASNYSGPSLAAAGASGHGGDMSFMRGMVVRSSFGAVSGGTGFSSTADRSATEIYEAHHYEASSSHVTQQQQQQQQQQHTSTSSSWVQRRE